MSAFGSSRHHACQLACLNRSTWRYQPTEREVGVLRDRTVELAGERLFFGYHSHVLLHFIEQSNPVQNAFVESFDKMFQDELLNEHWFNSLADARRRMEDRLQYEKVAQFPSLVVARHPQKQLSSLFCKPIG